jgi:MATE family multidrug resistance protein
LFFTLSDCFYIALVGRYDSLPVSHFAGASMGMMLVNVTGLSLGIGFAGALGPFVSQEYGKGCTTRNGLHLLNFVQCAMAIFLFSLLASNASELLLVAVGQDSELAANVQRYARIGVWAVPGQILVKALQQVLDAQRDVAPGLVVDVIGAVLQVPMCWSVLRVGGGFSGAAYVKVFVSTLMCAILIAWIHLTGRGLHVWSLPADEPPASMWLFLRQAVPNTFATCVEWWAQEFIALLAGLLPHASLTVASNGILFNCAVVFYMTWVGSKKSM